jgi:hypothetical protein
MPHGKWYKYVKIKFECCFVTELSGKINKTESQLTVFADFIYYASSNTWSCDRITVRDKAAADVEVRVRSLYM